MARELTPGRYGFEDVAPGDHFRTDAVRITSAMIDDFAGLTGDRFEIHMEDDAARALGFPARVAHGLLVLSLIDGLKNQAPVQFAAVASLGWNWSFRAPVLIGHEISAAITVEERRATSRPGRGILKLAFAVRETGGALLQEGSNLLMVRRSGRD